MAIQVRDSAEFHRLLKTIAFELVDANIAFRMHTDLIAAYEGGSGEVMRQAWTFWSLTIQGHGDSAVFRLCRIYDQKKTNLGLRGFLDTVRANQHLFSVDRFAERVQDRAHANVLVANFDPLEAHQIDTDMEYVTRASNPMVERLMAVRHNYYSHRNAQDVVKDVVVSEAYPHMRDEVGDLLHGGMEIVNRYSMLFDANMWSTHIIGRDDYNYVLRAARERLERHRVERDGG